MKIIKIILIFLLCTILISCIKTDNKIVKTIEHLNTIIPEKTSVDLELITNYQGAIIEYISNNNSSLSNTGKVNLSDVDVSVTLTIIITYNYYHETFYKTVIVLKDPFTFKKQLILNNIEDDYKNLYIRLYSQEKLEVLNNIKKEYTQLAQNCTTLDDLDVISSNYQKECSKHLIDVSNLTEEEIENEIEYTKIYNYYQALDENLYTKISLNYIQKCLIIYSKKDNINYLDFLNDIAHLKEVSKLEKYKEDFKYQKEIITTSLESDNYTVTQITLLNQIIVSYQELIEKEINSDIIRILFDEFEAEISITFNYDFILDAYKEAKINDLKNYYSNIDQDIYSFESLYVIGNLIETGIELIEESLEFYLCDFIYNNVLYEISKIDTISPLQKAKEVGKSKIVEKYDKFKENDFYEESFVLIKKLKDDAIIDIHNALSEIEVSLIVSDTIISMTEIGTIKEIENARRAGKAQVELLRSNILDISYSKENFDKINELIVKALKEINSSYSITLIDNLVERIKNDLNNVSKYNLEDLIKSVQEKFEFYCGEALKELYSEKNYEIYQDIFKKGIEDVAFLKTIIDVENFYNKVLEKASEVSRKLTESEIVSILADIELILFDVLNFSTHKVTKNLNFIQNSIHNSIIIWEVSKPDIISSTGELLKDIDNIRVDIKVLVILDDITYELVNFYVFVNTVRLLSAYYDEIDLDLLGSNLKLELRSLLTMTHHKRTSYDELRKLLQTTDADVNISGNIMTLYSKISLKGTWDSGLTWNREHVWPQSKGWFSTSGAGADIHHIRPETPKENNSRGNKAFGVTTTTTHYGVKEESRGDVARILFYLFVRYQEADSYNVTTLCTNMEMLISWNIEDPVDEFELRRNEESFKIQGNRNPFIDYPEFASMIW